MGGGAAQAEQVLHQQGKQVRDGQGRFALILLIELPSARCASNLPCIGSCARIVATKKRWNRCARSSTPNPSAIVRAGESFNQKCGTKQSIVFLRSLGILELIPDMVSCQKACTRRRRTVFLLSKFQLVSEKEVFPRLVVRLGEEWRVDSRIRQPIETTVVANRLFVFVMPEQDEDAVAEIYREGGKVFLDAYRPRDKTSSNVKLEMELKVHNSPDEVCPLCIEDPDKIDGRPTGGESLQQRLVATGTARGS